MPLSQLASRAAGPLSTLRRFIVKSLDSNVSENDHAGRMAAFESLNDRIVPANFTLNGETLLIQLLEGESVTLDTTGEGSAEDGGTLTLDGTLWSGTDVNYDDEGNIIPIVVGKGQQILNFANFSDPDEGVPEVTKVVVNGLNGNSFTFGETIESDLNASVSVALTNGLAVTNTGIFSIDSPFFNDALSITADGVDVTQSGTDAGFLVEGNSTFDLGLTGNLLLDSSNNAFCGSTTTGEIEVINANDVTIVEGDTLGCCDYDTYLGGIKASGDLDVTNESAYGGIITNDSGYGYGYGYGRILDIAGSSTFRVTSENGGDIEIDGYTEGGDFFAHKFGGPVSIFSEAMYCVENYVEAEGDLVIGDVVTNGTDVGFFARMSITQTEDGAIITKGGDVEVGLDVIGNIILANAANDLSDPEAEEEEEGCCEGAFYVYSDTMNLSLQTKGDLCVFSEGGTVIQDATFVSGKSVEIDGLRVFGTTTIEAAEDVLLGYVDGEEIDGGNDFSKLGITQTGSESEVLVVDPGVLTLFGSIAGNLKVYTEAILTLGGGIGDLSLVGDGEEPQESFFFSEVRTEVLGSTVNLGTGESSFEAESNAPLLVSDSGEFDGLLTFGDDAIVNAEGGIKVAPGAELIGGGTIVVGAAGVDVAEGGLIAPTSTEEPFTGLLNVVGSLTVGPLGLFGAEIASTEEGGNDLTTVEGVATITDAELALQINPGYVPAVGDTFTILTAELIEGEFGNLDENGQLVVDGITFQVTTTETSVDLEVVSVVPVVTGDGIGLYRPGTAEFVFNTSDVFDFNGDQFFTLVFGDVGDQGFVGDFTGDGQMNIAVYRDPSETDPGFFIINTSSIFSFDPDAFVITDAIGNGDEIAFAGDWDGDGDDDLGLYRNADATYVTINLPTLAPGQTGAVGIDPATQVRNIVFGNPSSTENPTDPPAVGNFRSDFVADQIGFGAQGTLDLAAVDIASLGFGDFSVTDFFNPDPEVFGTTGDQQLNGMYEVDEDGLDQRGVFRSSSATFSISSGSQPSFVFGAVGDVGLVGNWVGGPLPVTESQLDSFFEDDDA
ncbi:hypothetical protein Pan216_35990 [Planctomycetes bacterium Pan216]|uniref:FG-GAP repeat protein n=1 Tax=Kolteria novifilia TaxID=2527975 RepID=A0A518B6X6_9BACT|nr:hypothetical protein Pan216_35990 [Planctomycetes bacterium Pan216]